LQWFDARQINSINGPWTNIAGEFRVLSNECGIYFEGKMPPIHEIYGLNTSGIAAVQIRMTACVRFDVRASGSFKGTDSPLADTSTQFLELGNRYHWRYVHYKSINYAAVQSGSAIALQDDDRAN